MSLAVAFTGIRGIPANFGGSETAVEEIAARLADAEVDVTVYGRRHNSTTTATRYRGVRRVTLPSVNTFRLDTVSHSLLATLHFRFCSKATVIHYSGMGNGLALPLLWGSGKRSVVTIDGPDWLRPKWGPAARSALRLGARLCVGLADHLIIDNHPSIAFFEEHFGVTGTYIPYGADRTPPGSDSYLQTLGLDPRGYVLFVGALVPDKGPDILLDAYREVNGSAPLVVVGDSPFAAEYRDSLRELAARDPRVRMLGYVRGNDYLQLVANAGVYVHPLRSDGTSPALLQAMGFGNCIVVNSVPETLSAVGDAAVRFERDDPHDLAVQLSCLLTEPELAAKYRRRALRRAETEYDWGAVADAHLAIFRDLADRGRAET